jgi:hypothetical protein
MDEQQKLQLGYTEALAQLRQHPPLIWTRNNFFLLTQSGLLAFTLNIENRSEVSTLILACTAGLLLAVVWLWVNWAGRKLQRLWRGIVQDFEKELFAQGAGDVKGPFERAKELEGKSRAVSITWALMLLAIGFIILWIVLLCRL